jgi:hypothetical protein
MEIAVTLLLMYLAMGVAFFAHPRGRATPDNFTPMGQASIFFDTLPLVLTWPLAVWRLIDARR